MFMLDKGFIKDLQHETTMVEDRIFWSEKCYEYLNQRCLFVNGFEYTQIALISLLIYPSVFSINMEC